MNAISPAVLAIAPLTHADRIGEALAAIDNARAELTRAICLLGHSDGMEAVQIAHLSAGQASRVVALLAGGRA